MLKNTSIHSVPRPFDEGTSIENARNPRQKQKLNQALSSLLASTYGLYQECLYYYWTVAGNDYIGLEDIFEKQYESLQDMSALIDKRLSAINYSAGDESNHLYLPTFPDNRSAVTSPRDMLMNIVKGHNACSKQALSALEIAETLDDQKTATILLQTMLMHDKSVWMMKSLYS